MVGVLANGEIFLPAFNILGTRTPGETNGDGNVSFHFEVAGTAKVAKSANVALSLPGCTIAGTAEMRRGADGEILIDQFSVYGTLLTNTLCSSRLEHVR
jgi:hypothetical protein